MADITKPVHKPAWYMIPARVIVMTFLGTLLSFALSLLLGILGILAGSKLRGVAPDMTVAYRHIAAPVAGIVGAIVLVSSLTLEIRHYQQAKALAEIERSS